jgi:hypothetical protein
MVGRINVTTKAIAVIDHVKIRKVASLTGKPQAPLGASPCWLAVNLFQSPSFPHV